jgi:hypothetical protein
MTLERDPAQNPWRWRYGCKRPQCGYISEPRTYDAAERAGQDHERMHERAAEHERYCIWESGYLAGLQASHPTNPYLYGGQR